MKWVARLMPSANFRRYEYRRYLPHYQRDDRPLFVTFRTRKPLELSPEARTLALQHCIHDSGITVHLHAAVVMPDHVHRLFTALRDSDDVGVGDDGMAPLFVRGGSHKWSTPQGMRNLGSSRCGNFQPVNGNA